MTTPFQELGLARNASKDEAKAAFRKLASQYHPDKVTDEGEKKRREVKFKIVKEAYELIDNGWTEPVERTYSPYQQPQQYHKTWSKPEPAFEGVAAQWMHQTRSRTARPSPAYQSASQRITPYQHNVVQAYREPAPRNNLGDFIARVSMAEAYHGFICEVTISGTKYRVNIPAGIPHGLRFAVPVEGTDDVNVTTLFTQSSYTFKGVHDAKVFETVIVNSGPAGVYRVKDLSIRHEVNARELNRGTTITLQDFLGSSYTVNVPYDHDVRKPLKVEGKGYVDWYPTFSKAGEKRGDVYITLVPTEKVEATMI